MSDTAYKIDGPKEIPTESLLFWPNNPRLKISDFKEVKFSIRELLDPKNQQNIFNLLLKNEHGVDVLVKSMSKVGFMREKAPIVMRIEGSKKYLVLEGNRRLTSIRYLLSQNRNKLNGSKYKSLLHIPCWLFIYTSKQIPLGAAISRLIAEQHLKGQKPHTKIQQAHMLYNAYMGFLLEKNRNRNFIKDPKTIKKSADFFDMGHDEFELELAVVRFYKQLFNAGYDTPHKFRERLTWVYKNPRHFRRNFGYQENLLKLDNPGLERYHDIFIKKGCAVHSPVLFKKFVNVMRYGKPEHIEVLRYEPDQLRFLEQEVLDKKSSQRFFLELERINKKLAKLKLSEYQETNDENQLILSINNLVNSKLKKLAKIENGGEKGKEMIQIPHPGDEIKIYAQLSSNDDMDPLFDEIYYKKDFGLLGIDPGDKINIDASSTDFSADLFVLNPENEILFQDDNDVEKSFISFYVKESVDYILRVSTEEKERTGSFQLKIENLL